MCSHSPLLVKGGLAIAIFPGGILLYIHPHPDKEGGKWLYSQCSGRNMAMASVKNGSRTLAIVKLKNFYSSNVNKLGVADI